MKKIFLTMLICLPMIGMAQNVWEMPKAARNGKAYNPDAKYLTGAVPVVDGRVQFDTTIVAPDKTARQIYDIILPYLTEMTTEEGQFEQSRITQADTVAYEIAGSYQEWLVFVNKPLNLDRTRLFYTLFVKCSDGKADVTLTRIYYLYDEERDPQNLRAEEWITDEHGLKRNKNKLSRVSGKFRRKTIDRKDYIFNQLADLLK